jgi:hypothetical protein
MIDRERATPRVTRRGLIVAGLAAGACSAGSALKAGTIAAGLAPEKPALHEFVHADISDYLIGL